jgi:energy-converting hydrogenase B subunit D
MSVLQVVVLVLTAAGAAGLVVARDPVRLVLLSSIYALVLGVLFTVFQAPDVALSQLVVGAIVFPLVLAVAITKERG